MYKGGINIALNVYILTFLSSSLYKEPTGKKLADFAGFKAVNTLKDHTVNNNDFLIRYGICSYPRKDIEFIGVLNKADYLPNAINKSKMSRLLLLNNINTPKIWYDKNLITENDLPVLGRKNLHSRGNDIQLIQDIITLKKSNADYYVKFIENVIAEYRLHVFNKEPIRLQKKVLVNGKEPHFIKNVEHGYVLADHYKSTGFEKGIIKEGLKAIKVLGLDFGAVDVLVDKNGKVFILEVNTAPRLNRFGRELYSWYIKKYLNDNYNCQYDLDLKLFPRLRERNDDLPIKFRDIIHNDRRNCYE